MHAERTNDWRPFRALQQALLMDSFKVLGREPLIVRHPAVETNRLRFIESQRFVMAMRWLLSKRDDHPLDYVTICEAFDLDAEQGVEAVERIVSHRKRLAERIRRSPKERAKIRWRKTDGSYWSDEIKPPWMKDLAARVGNNTNA